MALHRRLLAESVDRAAELDPERLFAVIPKGSELSDGFQNLTMERLSQAVNFLCQWIENTIGTGGPRETLAYMGNNDVRYCIFILACQKTGHQAFLPSARNADEAHIYLLKATHCTKFFFAEERSTRVLELKELNSDLGIFQVPSLKLMLADENGLTSYPIKKSYNDVEDTVTCIIHSSGTTGMPKPVPLTNGFWSAFDNLANLNWPKARQPSIFFRMGQQDLALATTPFFHLMGLFSFALAIFHDVPVLIGPDKPLSVEYLTELLQITRPTTGMFPPSILEDMSHSPDALECLRNLKSVEFGGAPLAPETGDRLRQYTQVIPVIGTSEIGWIPSMVPEEGADWSYFEWNDSYGVDMQSVGDGLYEMVIQRHPESRALQGIFHTFPDIEVYRTKDVYTRHPTKNYLWKFDGRIDDVIVLSNGEKFNPTTMETIIEGHELIAKAIVIGQSRFQASLLVEPNVGITEMDTGTFIQEIWPTVQAANQTIAAHGRVMKSRIGIVPKGKTFERTPKGSVKRRSVLENFEKEINEIYQAGLEEDLENSLPESLDRANILKYTREIFSQVLEKPGVAIDQDLYSIGLDSLMTMQVAKVLERGIQHRQPTMKPGIISPQTIYSNPTVNLLAGVISDIVEGKSQKIIPRDVKINNMVEKYTRDLPETSSKELQPSASPTTVILTGSTGSLGTYLLHDLLKTPSVSKVFCLNRSDAEQRQKDGLEEKGLLVDTNEWASKVEFLQASFGDAHFGLTEDKYKELLQSVDTIIHNAWKVDFNHSVESFEDTHIKGVRNFVDFSLKSKYNAHIHFVSSISTVGAWTTQMGQSVPEVPMEDSAVVLPQGYGESKHVAERICLEASRRSHVPTTVYRVGQIGGPTTVKGKWNPQEWLPTIIATSKAMGKIPARLGSMPVDWIPVDTLSSIMTDIVHTRHGDQTEFPHAVFHLTNPETASWSSLIPAIQQKYNVEPVEFAAWVAELESVESPSSADVAEKPALKLLSFYRGLVDDTNAAMSVALDVQKTKEASKTMNSLQPISAPLMANWLKQWQF
ncbi:acetyl-CoA synthetase-like protein [Penicillium verhagenii]|uniref:acetyl-CoA synthetase-like protein n=1 Tax=Penicillium verhagenii TaxID=1562060 RepID=UPI002544FA4B|nr:acetyl-CoA synthetase-like protein [Penicillium verhagenii]KAJ5947051.1 acetyl-CoA synthetase-like protein [Penicillium verhagenii]